MSKFKSFASFSSEQLRAKNTSSNSYNSIIGHISGGILSVTEKKVIT